jgi:ribosome recycling factor
MPIQIIADMERRMNAALEDLDKDLGSLRTGRAAPSLLDKVLVDYHGSPLPLNQLGSVSAPDARQIVVTPWDKAATSAIANAISKSDLGVQAVADGPQVRVSIPSLNEERRKEMVKLAGKKTEDHKVAIRNVRRTANDALKKMEKDGELTKDDLQRHEADVQKITDRFIADAEKMRASKEIDILDV